ncbi:hypothetical protein [Nocardioides ferulae]|uniref:hypothetical protein n=1 Tax=Nocardioides ferulae TaxID=2340821 RepID=UPI000F870E8C|nr:hypothetical protein [Nocardioides ferulae]
MASPTRADAVRAFQALAPTIDDAFVRRRGTVSEDPAEVRVASREPGTVFVAVVEEAHAPEHFEPLRPYGGW